jgi:hypothetical protein
VVHQRHSTAQGPCGAQSLQSLEWPTEFSLHCWILMPVFLYGDSLQSSTMRSLAKCHAKNASRIPSQQPSLHSCPLGLSQMRVRPSSNLLSRQRCFQAATCSCSPMAENDERWWPLGCCQAASIALLEEGPEHTHHLATWAEWSNMCIYIIIYIYYTYVYIVSLLGADWSYNF